MRSIVVLPLRLACSIESIASGSACALAVSARPTVDEPATLPGFFGPVQQTIASLRAHWAAENLTPLAGCLRCVLRSADIDTVIVGVNRRHELDEIEAALSEIADHDGEFEPAAAIDPIYLDPRRWPSVMQ